MSDVRSELADFLRDVSETDHDLADDADVFDSLGLEGDDAFEFIEAFAARFAVDLNGYQWHFHNGEEGLNLGAMFFRPPYSRVERVPITPRLLIEAIETGRWPLTYPPHDLPKVRWDIRINQLLLVVTLALLALWAWGVWPPRR